MPSFAALVQHENLLVSPFVSEELVVLTAPGVKVGSGR